MERIDQSEEDVLDIVEGDDCQDTDESDEVEIGCDSSDESHRCVQTSGSKTVGRRLRSSCRFVDFY